jgi:Sulfatase-modifying factor enzyme 1
LVEVEDAEKPLAANVHAPSPAFFESRQDGVRRVPVELLPVEVERQQVHLSFGAFSAYQRHEPGHRRARKEGRKYPWGDNEPTPELARFDTSDTSPVTSHPEGATPEGIHHLGGNVWEWCRDWYREDYSEAERSDPLGPEQGLSRVMRGGAFDYNPYTDYEYFDVGLRVAWSAAGSARRGRRGRLSSELAAERERWGGGRFRFVRSQPMRDELLPATSTSREPA